MYMHTYAYMDATAPQSIKQPGARVHFVTHRFACCMNVVVLLCIKQPGSALCVSVVRQRSRIQLFFRLFSTDS